MCSSRKFHTPPQRVFCFSPLLPPGNSSLVSYFTSKILTLNTPLPLEFPMIFHGVGMDFFLELHNTDWSRDYMGQCWLNEWILGQLWHPPQILQGRMTSSPTWWDPGNIGRSPLSVVTGNIDLYRQTPHLLYDPLKYLVNCLPLMFHF